MRKRGAPKWLKAARAQNRRPTASDFDWLSRALSRAGVLPDAEAEEAIRAGRVRVNGQVRTLPLSAVRPSDRIALDGAPVSIRAPTLAVMLHKAAGLICAPRDPEGVGTVFDALLHALPPELHRYGWRAIGRLDRNTTGLLLFTNDERLVQHVTAPATHLPKRYVARVSGEATDERLEPLRRGVALDDGPARPAQARIRAPGVVELTLTEGRYHQVKRMLGAVGLPVLSLHREAVGDLVLDVSEGAARLLSEQEITQKLRFKPGAEPVIY